MPVKKQEASNKKQVTRKTMSASLRAIAKQSLKNKKVAGVNKIATSSAKVWTPRNDEKVKKPAVKAKTTLNLSVPVYSLAGSKTTTSLALPKEIFGAKVNKALLAQAMRVYSNNLKSHFAHTKTRGEVKGSTRKIFRQKGTGRARHGAIRAPIFVGGGIALGPKSRKVMLDLPAKMKNAALLSALAQKIAEKAVLGISGLDKASGKTKEMAKFVSSIKPPEASLGKVGYQVLREDQETKNKKQKMSMLIVGDKNYDGILRAVSNIEEVHFLNADQINAYEVIKHQSLVLTREAIEKLQERLIKKI